MIPLWVKVGAKVACIDAQVSSSTLHPNNGNMGGLLAGRVYTISGVVPHSYDGVVGIRLTEITRGPLNEPFGIFRFRPLNTATESEDLAVFRRIADLAGVDEALRRLEGVE